MPLETSAEAPVPVRTVMRLVGDWVGRLGRVWVEGQIAELNRRGSTAFLTLRDPLAAVSVRVICTRAVLEATESGARGGRAGGDLGQAGVQRGPGQLRAGRRPRCGRWASASCWPGWSG